LSTFHSCTPSARIFKGGSLIEIKSGDRCQQPEQLQGVKRGVIKAFSHKSRRKLMRLLGQTKREELPIFVTLTYPDDKAETTIEEQRDVLRSWWQRVEREHPGAGAIWKREWKQRKSGNNLGKVVPHFHFLIWGMPMEWESRRGMEYTLEFAFATASHLRHEWRLKRRTETTSDGVRTVTPAWETAPADGLRVYETKRFRSGMALEIVEEWERTATDELATLMKKVKTTLAGNLRSVVQAKTWVAITWEACVGSDDPRHLQAGTRVEAIRSRAGVMHYASKYIAKVDEEATDRESIGRCWGVMGRQNIPWCENVEFELSEDQRRRLLRISRRYVAAQMRQRGKRFKLRPSVRGWSFFAASPESWVANIEHMPA
jgi:hypothetical protein